MILYIDNPKDATRKLLVLINEYSKVAGHKINTQKSKKNMKLKESRLEKKKKNSVCRLHDALH